MILLIFLQVYIYIYFLCLFFLYVFFFLFYVFFLVLLFWFTVLKLPQARLTGLMQGYVQVALDPYGIFLSDQGRELSVLTGLRYSLLKPAIEFPDQTRIELDDFSVSPNLMALLSGKMGAHANAALRTASRR